MKIIFTLPFVFNTPFGIDAKLKLYRKDTLFNDVNRNFGLQYLLSGGNYFKAFINYHTSDLLISKKGLQILTSLPPYADVSNTAYGIGFKTEKLDYRLNPRKGIALNLEGSVGNKTIKENSQINPELYKSLDLKTVQYSSILQFDLFIPLWRRSTVNMGIQSGYLYNSSDSTIFENELFRIGGLKTLRGFDEESIFASGYSIVTLEFRYLLEQNSYMYVFADGAWYENKSVSASIREDLPYGFGAGISFETKAGIFSINYALGGQNKQAPLLKSAKIHFGFVNFF